MSCLHFAGLKFIINSKPYLNPKHNHNPNQTLTYNTHPYSSGVVVQNIW